LIQTRKLKGIVYGQGGGVYDRAYSPLQRLLAGLPKVITSPLLPAFRTERCNEMVRWQIRFSKEKIKLFVRFSKVV
jgi:hypothetical protein